jgi:hypothetical protein
MITFFDLLPKAEQELKKQKVQVVLDARKRITEKEVKAQQDLPSTYANDSDVLTGIYLNEDGTIQTTAKNAKYPMRFYVPYQEVNVTAAYKKLFSLLIANGAWGFLALWLNKKIWSKWLKRMFELYPILLKDKYWSQTVKEIRRVLKGKIDDNELDAISAVLENDMAYRYRVQDILGEIDRYKLQQNPLKEIKRLIGLSIEREQDERNVKKLKIMRKYIWLLRFKGLREITDILKDLHTNEIKLSKEDIYWTNIVPNYNYRGISYQERLKERETVDKTL